MFGKLLRRNGFERRKRIVSQNDSGTLTAQKNISLERPETEAPPTSIESSKREICPRRVYGFLRQPDRQSGSRGGTLPPRHADAKGRSSIGQRFATLSFRVLSRTIMKGMCFRFSWSFTMLS